MILRDLMESWVTFVNSMDTNGGHMLFLFVVIIMAAIMEHYGIKEADQMITFALGVMSRGMGAAK